MIKQEDVTNLQSLLNKQNAVYRANKVAKSMINSTVCKIHIEGSVDSTIALYGTFTKEELQPLAVMICNWFDAEVLKINSEVNQYIISKQL